MAKTMTKRNNEELISDLAEEDRNSVDEEIKMLHGVLRNLSSPGLDSVTAKDVRVALSSSLSAMYGNIG